MSNTRLRELRAEKPQSEVCNALGLSQATYSNYERGRAMPYSLIIKAADYFNVSIDYMLKRNNSATPYRPVPLTKVQKNLLSMYALMDAGQQLRFYGFAVGVLSQSGKDVTAFIL